MKFKHILIKYQLLLAFSILNLFMIFLGVVSYIQTSEIFQQTDDLYNHPLKVRRAIGEFKATIININKGMTGILLLESEEDQINSLIHIKVLESHAIRQLEIIESQYLGPSNDIHEVKVEFVKWNANREETIRLYKEGDFVQARKRISINSEAGKQASIVLDKLEKISVFSALKGDELYTNAKHEYDQLLRQLYLIIFIVIILSVLINYIIIRNIRNPLKQLIKSTTDFKNGDQDSRCNYKLDNEFGQLSLAFNSLATEIQSRTSLHQKTEALINLFASTEQAKEFFELALKALAEQTNAQMAAIYLRSEDQSVFEHFYSFGFGESIKVSFNANLLEGEFGLCLATQKIQIITDISENSTFSMETVNSRLQPKEIISIPIISGNDTIAVISLASIQQFSNDTITLLHDVWMNLNARIESIIAFKRITDFSFQLERKNQELEEQKEKLYIAGSYNRALIEASIDPLVTIGQNGKITDVNRATEEITGHTREELIGTDIADYFTDQVKAKAGNQQAFKDGFIKNYELELQHKSGKKTPVLFSAAVYRNNKGIITGVFASARDITEQKQSQQELIRLNDELTQKSEYLTTTNQELVAQKMELTSQSAELTEQNIELELQKKQLDEANRLKTNFLSNMSHELRTPLNSVIALSGVLNRRLKDSIPCEEFSYLEVIERNGKLLLSLINDILDLSRIEAGKEEIEVTDFNVNELVQEVIEIIKPQALQKNIGLVFNHNANISILISDYVKCRHILQNIIGNAVKFTETGQVEISVEDHETQIGIMVKDTGIGIDQNHINHIFDEFRQADGSTARKYGGTGLGLAIAKKYAHLLGGTITVKSEPGAGSEFVVFLPLTYSNTGIVLEDSLSRFNKISTGSQAIHKADINKTILIVDDSEPAIIQIKDILESKGYKTVSASGGKQALAHIELEIPDAIILDLMMPEVDGFEVLKKIRENEKTANIPVLILTAKHINKEDLKFLTRNNVHQLVQKGNVNAEELLENVAKMVSTKPQNVEDTISPLQVRDREKPVILVVEDNIDNMLTVKAIIGNRYEIIEAYDGQEGLSMAIKFKPDLILMDIALPIMDGIETFKAIRNKPELQKVPVIALTASAMTSDRETILAYGFSAYISKPIDENIFFKIIKSKLYGS